MFIEKLPLGQNGEGQNEELWLFNRLKKSYIILSCIIGWYAFIKEKHRGISVVTGVCGAPTAAATAHNLPQTTLERHV